MKHELYLLSLHDAQAECACGGWSYVKPGLAPLEDLIAQYRQHLRQVLHYRLTPHWINRDGIEWRAAILDHRGLLVEELRGMDKHEVEGRALLATGMGV